MARERSGHSSAKKTSAGNAFPAENGQVVDLDVFNAGGTRYSVTQLEKSYGDFASTTEFTLWCKLGYLGSMKFKPGKDVVEYVDLLWSLRDDHDWRKVKSRFMVTNDDSKCHGTLAAAPLRYYNDQVAKSPETILRGLDPLHG